MMWLPQQSRDGLAENVARSSDVGPDHVSLYLLELYPNAPLRDEMARAAGRWRPTRMRRRCISRDWRRSTRPGTASTRSRTSPRPGRESRHNLKYWTDGEWLGFGCGAHSTRGGVRWKNVSSTDGVHRRASTAGGRSPSSAAG